MAHAQVGAVPFGKPHIRFHTGTPSPQCLELRHWSRVIVVGVAGNGTDTISDVRLCLKQLSMGGIAYDPVAHVRLVDRRGVAKFDMSCDHKDDESKHVSLLAKVRSNLKDKRMSPLVALLCV